MDRPTITKQSSTNIRKADSNAIPMRFDVSKVPSTVTNPSQNFKGISVEDEQKIYDLVNKKYPNGTDFEKQQATQGYYNSALNSQKLKDIDTYRQKVKLSWINQANNTYDAKEKNEYLSKVKKADLADMIKDQLIQSGYKAKDFIGITDDGIIAGFLEVNPDYKDSFNKYFYDNQNRAGQVKYNPNSITNLAKDLGWIEKTAGDVALDKAKGFGEMMLGWMPKFPEGLKDMADAGWEGADFDRFVKEKYGTYPAALTDRDLAQAKKDFENVDKKQYTPTLVGGAAKTAMGAADILFTTGTGGLGKNFLQQSMKQLLKNNAFKAGFSLLSVDDNMSRAPELLGDTLSFIGQNVNKLPGFSYIRDQLPTEQDKADWDAFIAGNVLSFLRKGNRKMSDIKDADMKGWKNAFDKWKNGGGDGPTGGSPFDKMKSQLNAGWDALKENSAENRAREFENKKLDKAQQTTQVDSSLREQAAEGLDTLRDEGLLKDIKNVDQLEKNILDLEEKLKAEQTEIATNEKKTFGESDLSAYEEVSVLDENGKKTTQKVPTSPFRSLLENIVEHYKSVGDSANATKFESYLKNGLEKGYLPADVMLEIKREGNNINSSHYNNKKAPHPNTELSKKWAGIMKSVNKVVEGLDIGDELRNRDRKLSALYTVETAIKEIKNRANNYKKTIADGGKVGKWAGGVLGRMLSRIQLGAYNLLNKILLSAAEETFSEGLKDKKYNPLQIEDKVSKFVDEYNKLMDKVDNNTSPNILEKAANAFINKWQLEAQYNEED